MSSTESDPTSGAGRRKFDDVASLFSPIVPAAGSPVRPPETLRPIALPQVSDDALSPDDGARLAPPPSLRAASSEPLLSLPSAGPFKIPPVEIAKPAAVVRTAPVRLEQRGEPANAARAQTDAVPSPAKRPAGSPGRKAPFPDAFAPRPNYRPTRKGSWLYWLFLVPFAGVVAVAITFVDARGVRNFIDQTLPQYLPAPLARQFTRSTPKPVLPPPFPPPIAPPARSAPSTTGAITLDEPPALAGVVLPNPPVLPTAVIEQAAPEPAAAPAQPPDPPAQMAAIAPTSAMPAAPAPESPAPVGQGLADPAVQTTGNDVSPAIPAPPNATPGPPPRVTVYYRRNQGGAESEARRVAAKIGSADIKASSGAVRSPMIFYFNPVDRDAATALARTLANEGPGGWIVRAGPPRPSAGTIEVDLP